MMQAGSVLHPLHPQRPRLDSLLPGLALLDAPAREVRRGDSLLWLQRQSDCATSTALFSRPVVVTAHLV